MEFTINETGQNLLNSKKHELEQKTKDIKQPYGNGNTAQFQSFMGTDRAWIPFQLFSGLLDVLFFASAMSFLGLAMSPQERSMAGDIGEASDSGSDSDTESQKNSGAADSTSSGGGNFEGGGFDSSGGTGMDFGGDFNF